MSEMTPCNHCTLNRVKASAKKRGASVQVRTGQDEWKGWLIVLESDKPEPTHYFRALTDHCVC